MLLILLILLILLTSRILLDIVKSGEFLILGLTMVNDGDGPLREAIVIADIAVIAVIAVNVEIAGIAEITYIA